MLGTTLGGRYKIISHLGGGGYGQTYLAQDIHLPNTPHCVVKQLKPQATDRWNLQIANRLFNTEAEVLYKLGNHNQIPRLFAHFEDKQEFYLVQEFIEGVDLSQELADGRQMRESQIIVLLKEILEILEFVHQQRVIHRDINPRNLIRRRKDGKLVLIDFGAVKQISTRVFNAEGEESKTVAIGTVGYMPQEQATGNPRYCSDIYAVGMIAVQALTGLDPSRHQLPRDLQTGEISWRNRAVVSPGLAKIIDRAIASHFADRYQTASEVLKDLKELPTYTESIETTAHTLDLQKQAPQSENSHKSPEIKLLPRSDRGKFVIPLKILLAIGSIGVLLALVKALGSTNFESSPSAQVVNEPPAISTPKTESQGISLAPLPNASPKPRLSQRRSARATRFYQRGEELRKSGQHEQALKAYNDALAINPAYAEAYWGRCFGFSNLGQYNNAIAACDKALQNKPDYYEAWWSKGNALDALQRYEEALAHYDRALSIKPDFPEAWSNRGATLNYLKRYEEALAAYDRALEINPELPEAWNNRGATLNRLQRYEEAVASYDKALKLKADYAEAWNNRGVVLTNLGQLPEAIASYDKAIELKPDYQPAIENRQRVQKAL